MIVNLSYCALALDANQLQRHEHSSFWTDGNRLQTIFQMQWGRFFVTHLFILSVFSKGLRQGSSCQEAPFGRLWLFQLSFIQQQGQNKLITFTCQFLHSNFPRLFSSILKIHYYWQQNWKSERPCPLYLKKHILNVQQEVVPLCTGTIAWCLIFNWSTSKVTTVTQNYRKCKYVYLHLFSSPASTAWEA